MNHWFSRCIWLATILLLAFRLDCLATPDLELKKLKELALSLLKKKDFGATTARCEYTTARNTNECSGPEKLESKIIVQPNGSVKWSRFRSWSESHDTGPGEFHGNFQTEKWKSLLIAISEMSWDETSDEMGPPLSMPGPSETIREIILIDGNRKEKYAIAGQAPRAISLGLAQPGMLAQYATDTLWYLSLNALKPKISKGIMDIGVNWTIAGKSSVRISIAPNVEDSSCGGSTLAWYYDRSEKSGETAMPGETESIRSQKLSERDKSWKTIDSKTPTQFQLQFILPNNPQKKPRTGKLIQFGILVKTANATSVFPVSLYSDFFAF